MYSPDAHRIIIIDTPEGKLIKLFASYSGGYLDGDSYRINSGTELITEDETHYFFHGFSGSIYKLRKASQGSLTSYTSGIYTNLLSQPGVREIGVEDAIEILKGEDIEYT